MRLGQHFLINKERIQQIIDALDLKSGDTIIEIGPGHGELTLELRIKNTELRIIAVEKDRNLANSLKEKFKDDKNIKIIEGDVLKKLPKIIFQFSNLSISNYKVVGNIPYYITGYLFRTLGELEIKPSLIVLTIQKEVAERICAKPPKMNLLAASVQFWAKPEIIDYIPKKDFRPEPEVDGAIIRFKTYNLRLKKNEFENYYKFIKILFKQPRKTIFNNLRPTTNNQQLLIKKLKSLNINSQSRPQDLSLDNIFKIVRNIRIHS